MHDFATCFVNSVHGRPLRLLVGQGYFSPLTAVWNSIAC